MPSGRALGALVALGVICTAFAFLVFLALIREAGTSRAMVFTYVNPAVAVAAGVAFLSEPFTVTIAASFALILAGSLLATWTARSPAGSGRMDPAGWISARPTRSRSVGADRPGFDFDHQIRHRQRGDLDRGAGRGRAVSTYSSRIPRPRSIRCR